jgi:hypothetical protein
METLLQVQSMQKENKMKKVILIALLSVFVINVSALATKEAKPAATTEAAAVVTSNEIKGIVFDKSTNETLAGAAILINGKKLYSDLDGNFTLPAGATGTCELKVSMISYQDMVMKVDLSSLKSLKIELNQR